MNLNEVGLNQFIKTMYSYVFTSEGPRSVYLNILLLVYIKLHLVMQIFVRVSLCYFQ